ncbi:MAG TPA: methionyl-tRNA formyltransferase [Candidatus Limnocylindrales bacterium]|nr:methionyl-tRNA formyltransferase [Candidatus Limnocylindrales bacterium]
MTRPLERPVSTILLGSGAFAEPVLAALADHPSVNLRAVVTAPPRPVGRRQVETPTPVHARARELNLAVRTPERLRDPAAIADLLALEPDLVVLADYGQIVPPSLLDRRFGALNLHPSLLPRHRGATPIPAAILAGDHETGVSLIRMDDGIDTGPIVAVERTALGPGETAPELEARLAALAAQLLGASLDPWLRGELDAIAQGEEGATLTRPLRRGDGRLDPGAAAERLERTVRAYLPWPGTYLDLDGLRLVVQSAHVVPSRPGDEPGQIVSEPPGIALATVDGRLALDTVLPAGGRAMSGEAFLRGRPGVIGSVVTPEAIPSRIVPGNPAARPA